MTKMNRGGRKTHERTTIHLRSDHRALHEFDKEKPSAASFLGSFDVWVVALEAGRSELWMEQYISMEIGKSYVLSFTVFRPGADPPFRLPWFLPCLRVDGALGL